jgi:putative hemolysin
MDPFIGFTLLGLFTVVAGLLTTLEISITSMGKVYLSALLKRSQRRSWQRLFERPQLVASAVGLAADLLLVAAGILAVMLTREFFPDLTPGPQAGLALVFAASYLIVFGDVVPKHMARSRMGEWVLRLLRPLDWPIRALIPIAILSAAIAKPIRRLLRLRVSEEESLPTDRTDQIKFLLEAAEEYGLVDEEEERMMLRILAYDELTVRQVMVPRPEVVAVAVETPLGEVRDLIAGEGHSRYPVYEETRDNIIGILHAKDLLRFGYEERRKLDEFRRRLHEEFPQRLREAEERAKSRGVDPASDPAVRAMVREREAVERELDAIRERLKRVTLRDLIRPPFFTPMVKPISDLLREFQRTKQHMAIVVDEFGSMAGIVTLEDILEEIVGEISDEYDQPEQPIRQLSSREFLVDGDAELSLINEELGLELPTNGAVTIGGLVTQRLEEIPRPGRSVTIDGVTITVESATAREVLKVRLRLREPVSSSQTAA